MSVSPGRPIVWRVHLATPRDAVFDLLDSDAGRARFWALRTHSPSPDRIEFEFSNGERLTSRVVTRHRPECLALTYFGESLVTFTLDEVAEGGTRLEVRETGVNHTDWLANYAGWVSVLLTLKAAADHGVDLRNTHPAHHWEQGFVDV